VASSAVEQRSVPGPAPASGQRSRFEGWPSWWPVAAIVAGLLIISTVIVLLAKTRPGFDPYGWLVWGHQTIAGNLNTNAAPSWKPLPYLFTVPFAIVGHYQLWLWMIFSTAVSLSGVIFAGRIAYRLTGEGDRAGAGTSYPRYAAIVAGVFAGAALLGIRDYWHYILSYQSDPMIVSLTLGAIDFHLAKRYRWAFVLGALAALGRPEVWLFLGLYAIWCWRAVPSMRWLILAGVAVIAALWFGIPALTSRSPFVAGSNALGSGRAVHGNKVYGTVDRFTDMHETPLYLLALISIAIAVWRRDRVTLLLAAGALAWVIVEVAFSLHGWPGLQRYMFPAGAVMIVIAAVGVGRLLSEPVQFGQVVRWGAVVLVAVAVVALVPPALSRARTEHKDLRAQRKRTTEINKLSGTVNHYGGPARFKPCGEPLTRLEYQTILAWTLHVNVAAVGFKYEPAIHSGRPIVLFTPLSHGGWRVQALHQRVRSCRALPR
jgi:hypothetical protein